MFERPDQTTQLQEDKLNLAEQLRRAEALVKFNQLVTTTIDVPEIYRRTARLLSEELACSESLVSSWQPGQQSLQVEIKYKQTAESGGGYDMQPHQFQLDSYPAFKRALVSQQTINQTRADTHLTAPERAYFSENHLSHSLLLPIVQDGQAQGLIHLYRANDQPPFSLSAQTIAQQMATQLGYTLRNATFASEAQGRAAQFSTVNRINALLSTASNLREVMEGTQREIFSLVEATGMSIVLMEPEVERFRWLYAFEHGQEVDLSQIPLLPVTQGFSGQVYKQREVVVFNKAIDERSAEFRSITVGAKPSIWAGFPLLVANKFIGVLAIENAFDAEAFDQHDIEILTTISGPVAIAINNLIQFEQIQKALIIQSEQRIHLQTAAEVAAAASSILNLNALIQQGVDLIRERFALYYVGLFLVDSDRRRAVLKAGTGKIGRNQVERNHSVSVGGNSLVGGATGDGQPRIIQDVTTAEDWLPNPLLPATRSEIALPLRVRQRIIGALIVQSAEAHAFEQTLISTLQTLCDQLAVAIDNAQLLQTAQRYSNQLSVAANVSRATTTILDRDLLIAEVVELMRSRFDLYYVGLFLLDETEAYAVLQSGAGQAGRIQVERGHKLAVDNRSLIGQAILSNESRVAANVKTAVNYTPNPFLPDTRSEAALPLRMHGRIIGALTVQSTDLDAFSEETITVLQSLSDQLAISIENATLFAQAEAALQEMSNLYEASRQLGEAPDQNSTYAALISFAETSQLCDSIQVVMPTVAEENGERYITVATAWSRPGITFSVPRQLPLAQIAPYHQPSETASKVVIFADSQHEATLSEYWRTLLKAANITSTALLPIFAEGQWLATVILHRTGQKRPFTEEELKGLRTLVDQSAAILANQRLFAEIQAANEKLRQLDQLKTQFLANMSHELRTPLNSIIGFSRVILKGIDGPITPEQEEDLTSIHNNGQHLLTLINEILDMAKIEAGKMTLTFEEVDLAHIAREAITAVSHMLAEKDLALRTDINQHLPTIEADPVRLKQILINLLSNAAKYTDEGEVELVVFQDGTDCVQLMVRDTGIGIAPEDRETLFRAFEQVDSSPTRVSGGTGLGLPLTKWMVEMHHGKIWFDSQLGQGSTFYVRLPLVQPLDLSPQRPMTFMHTAR